MNFANETILEKVILEQMANDDRIKTQPRITTKSDALVPKSKTT